MNLIFSSKAWMELIKISITGDLDLLVLVGFNNTSILNPQNFL